MVGRDNPRRLLGVVRRNDIVRAYEVGALRREEARQRAEMNSKIRDTRAAFIDVPQAASGAAPGKTVAELHLPRAAVLVYLRRGNDLVIPRGNTQLQCGDLVTALCERESIEAVQSELRQWYQAAPDAHEKAPQSPSPDAHKTNGGRGTT